MAAPGGGGGAGSGAGAACAACKYQRRRCTPDCPLAEYFPHDRPRVFRNAHRLFGVSNILKTLARAGPDRRREAMHCIIFESQAWDVHPDSGCVPIIHDLQRQIHQAELDLRRVYAAIKAYRAAAAAQGRPAHPDSGGDLTASSSSAPSSSMFGFQPAAGNNDDDIAAEAFGVGVGGGGVPFMYGGDQQQLMMVNTAASDDENIAAAAASPVGMPPWMMQPPQYDVMKSTTDSAADMAAKLFPQLPQQDHRFFADDATMAPQFQHQEQPIPIQPAGLDDEMSCFIDSMDGDNEMAHESTSMDSSEKTMKAPKMEDANGFK